MLDYRRPLDYVLNEWTGEPWIGGNARQNWAQHFNFLESHQLYLDGYP